MTKKSPDKLYCPIKHYSTHLVTKVSMHLFLDNPYFTLVVLHFLVLDTCFFLLSLPKYVFNS